MKNKITILLYLFLSIGTGFHCSAQKKNNDPIRYTSALTYFLAQYPDLIFLTDPKEVVFTQKGSRMSCDSAVYNKKEQFFRCFRNVKVNQGDSVFMDANYLEYSAKTRLAMADGNVYLRNKRMNLSNQRMYFDRNINQVYYSDWGTIKDEDNTIVSKSARYFLNEGYIDFTEDVTVATNVNNKGNKKKYNVTSNHLRYFTNKKEVEVLGPTNIVNRDNNQDRLYTESGTYNTRSSISTSKKNGVIYFNGNTLKGDILDYNQNNGYASAQGNVRMIRPKDGIIITGEQGEMYRSTQKNVIYDSTVITKQAFVRKKQDKDSMYFHAKKIIGVKQPNEKYTLYGYDKARLFFNETQAKADSIVYSETKDKFELYKNPILWYKDNQITGDTIVGFTIKQKLDSVIVKRNAFVIAKTDSLTTTDFNQVKGRFLYALFRDKNNDVNFIHVEGDAQSLYFADERKKNKPLNRIGINRSNCAFINSAITNREIEEISCLGGAKSIMKPENLMPEDEKYLANFIWRDKEKFASKAAFVQFVYRKDENYEGIQPLNKPLDVNTIKKNFDRSINASNNSALNSSPDEEPKDRNDILKNDPEGHVFQLENEVKTTE